MDRIYEAYLEEAYGHTLWIDPKGKVVDISRSGKIHFEWLSDKFKLAKNEEFSFASRNGWIQVRNRANDISFYGQKRFISKQRKLISDTIDEKLLDGKRLDMFVDFVLTDDDGNVEKRVSFYLPDEDQKLRRFL